jgi:dTDP-4-dehydrorhamnose reductase
MKIILLGKYGQLGWELQRTLAALGDVVAVDFPEIDLSEPGPVLSMITDLLPDLVINATAYTDVEKAEEQIDLANRINGIAPGLIAQACRKCESAFIHYSTDYVFDGEKGSPYSESDKPGPINVYGKSKLVGENLVAEAGGAYLILRTSWVYSLRKGGFVNKVLEWSKQQPVMRIVDDQTGSPTWARMLAEITSLMIAGLKDNPYRSLEACAGIYHLAGDGCASRYEWAQAILEFNPDQKGRLTERIDPAKSNEFPTAASRPSFSGLDCSHFYTTFNLRLPPWQDALKLALSNTN